MGIVSRVAERSVDGRLELLRQGVLETIRFVVDGIERHAERLGEVLLEQTVVADDLEGDPLSRSVRRTTLVGDARRARARRAS